MILIFSMKSEVVNRISASISESYAVCESTAQLVRDVRRKTSSHLVIVGEDVSETDAIEAAKEIQLLDPTMGVLLLRHRVDLGITTAAMAAGIKAVLSYSDVEGLARTAQELTEFTRTMRSRGGESRELVSSGKVVVCYAPKGGVGKTTTSLNVAGALSSSGRGSVVVVDLDLQFGDVGVAAGISSRDGAISDLDGLGSNLNFAQIRPVLKEVAQGFSVLMAPADPSLARRVTSEMVTEVLRVLSEEFDWVIVDSPPAFTDVILAAFDVADLQIMITSPDLASIKNLDVASKTLKKVGLDRVPRLAIVNRFDPKISDKAQISVAAREVCGAEQSVVILESHMISESSSRGFVAALGKERKKVVKAYEPVVEFLASHRDNTEED